MALLSALALVAAGTPSADAADPATYQLPDATHARSLSAASDGTVWFVPSRGTTWEGTSSSVVGSVSPDGAVVEHGVAGFGAIAKLVVGPTDEVWVAGYRGGHPGERRLRIGRLSASGELVRVYSVGRRGWFGPMAVSGDAIWFGHVRFSGLATIDRVSIDGGAVRHFALQRRCEATAVAIDTRGALRFAEACRRYWEGEGIGPGRGSIGRIASGGQISRRPLPGARDYPRSLAVGADGTIWFGTFWFGAGRGYAGPSVGRITTAGALAQYRIPGGFPLPIAVGPDGRLWFQSAPGGLAYRALNSIGVDGRLGEPICAEPGCELEPTGLIGTAGGLWYGLRRPNLNTGGGGSGIAIENEIANEAGFIAHLMP